MHILAFQISLPTHWPFNREGIVKCKTQQIQQLTLKQIQQLTLKTYPTLVSYS